MKNRKFKTILATAGVALTLGLSAVFGGCNLVSARDGVDGKDLNIYDIYAAAKVESGNPDMTFTEFLREYLSYNPDQIENAVTLQSSINNALLSSVSIQAQFKEYEYYMETDAAYSGSGVIIDIDRAKGDMTVVTNCHVVYSAKAKINNEGYSKDIYLWLYGSESNYETTYKNSAISAKLIAASKKYDVAVLKVTGSDIVKKSHAQAANWSTAEEVYLGETVYAIGNANSQTMSANVGYISKDYEAIKVELGDSSPYEYNVLRTSAAINSGNSGGGLFNLGCEIVGLVNAKSKSEATGVGYALTAASTKRVVKSMLDNYDKTHTEAHYVGRFKHGIVVEVSDMYSTGLNDKGFAEIYEQVKVTRTDFKTPFYGKINSGDIIKHIKITRDGKAVEDIDINREHNFYDVMLSVREGDTVEITVIHDGSETTQSLTVGAGKDYFENV
ncbi:MAG: S1C family serine protease [Clostridia bacterium]|nr:S1C family serine protease [Clostridia bacterium]